jgi:hypothetical protein
MSLDIALADLEPLLQRRRVVLIGEPHGTVEFPALVARMVDEVLAAGEEVVVGLEIPMTEEIELGPVGEFWSRRPEFQDGRSSQAMADLVARLATLRKEGQPVRAVAMDGPWVAPGSALPLEALGLLEMPRDELMAQNLLAAIDAQPRAFTVVLAGSMHTSTHGEAWRTLGSILQPWFPVMVSLMGQLTGGTRWVLPKDSSEGRVVEVEPLELPAGALWADEPGADGHHGYLNVGPVTASPPYHP